MTQPYDDTFFKTVHDGARRSAHQLLPVVFDLVKPGSVVDVGCGDGTWLSVVRALGVADIWGVDGDYVDRKSLKMPEDRFQSLDLAIPFSLPRRFDLAVSLEVAEHLPEASAAGFVESLVGLADVVLFSAAIPLQGGVHHVNEQWQDYWAKHFAQHGYDPVDCVRAALWENNEVDWWYAQNTLLYVNRTVLASRPELRSACGRIPAGPLSIVHPKKYLAHADLGKIALRKVATAFPAMLSTAVKRTLHPSTPPKTGNPKGRTAH